MNLDSTTEVRINYNIFVAILLILLPLTMTLLPYPDL